MPSTNKIVIGMQVRLRKPHACGGNTWAVTRTGADIGIVCQTCGHKILLERDKFERSVKEIVASPSPNLPPT